jgi:hypothetical protein
MTTAELDHSITRAAPLRSSTTMPADASRTWVSTAGQSRNSGDRNISITMRLDTVTTPMLLKVEHSGWLQPNKLVTHRFAMDDKMKA